MTKYKHEMSGGAAVGALSNLGRQISVAARAAGQHVTLPTASPPSGGAQPANTPSGKIDLTA